VRQSGRARDGGCGGGGNGSGLERQRRRQPQQQRWSESSVAAAARAALTTAADGPPGSQLPLTATSAGQEDDANDPSAAAALADPKRLLRRLQSSPSAAEAERTLLLALPHLNHIHLSAASVSASRLARRLSVREEEAGQEEQQQQQQQQQRAGASADLARLMATLERLHERALPRLPARALAHLAAAEAAAGRSLPPRLARGMAEQLLRSGARRLRAASAADLAMLAWGLAAHERRALKEQAVVTVTRAEVGDWRWPEELWDALSERIAAQGAHHRGNDDGDSGDGGENDGDGDSRRRKTKTTSNKGLRALDLRQLSRMARAFASAGRTMSDAALEALSEAALVRLDRKAEEQKEDDEAAATTTTSTVPLARNLQAPDPDPLVHLVWAFGRMRCGSGPSSAAGARLLHAIRTALEPQLSALTPAALAASVGGLAGAEHASAPEFAAAAAPVVIEKARLFTQDALVEVARAYANFPLEDADAAARLREALVERCRVLVAVVEDGGDDEGRSSSSSSPVTPTSARKLLRDLGGALPEEVRARLEAIAAGGGGWRRKAAAAAAVGEGGRYV
jgi:hypothetical protein